MDLTDKNLSLRFYNYLCDIIGSPDVVKTRRTIFTLLDLSDLVSDANDISSGSKAEGLDLKGSDYDRMFSAPFIRVYERLNDVQYDLDKIILHMDTHDSKPGFTKLKLVSNHYIDSIQDLCVTEGEETFISSKLFREDGLLDGMVIHGPCKSSPSGDYDSAECFRCEEWITPAQQWIHRSHHTLVTSAVQYGVLFVPIGCKNSPNEDLEWRISFSITEKMLIYSFSHTQLLCYALLKIILKDLIKRKHGELLCSYFLKTIMFWLSEEISPSEWKPENMISCFLDCIRRLIYCVEYKTCLHYFIPENNLFEDRFTKDDQQALLDTLRFVYGSPWTSLFQTETFLNYRLQSVNSHWKALSASALSCFSYTCIRVSCSPCSIYKEFKRFGNGHTYIFRKEMCAYFLCACYMESIRCTDFYNLADRNKSFYKQYKILFCHFKISLQLYSVTSWLLLASLYYNCKRFRECFDIINYCLFSCTPDKIYLHPANSWAEQTVFNQMNQSQGLLHSFKYLIIENVLFQYPFCLLPNELIALINGESLQIPPVVYSYLLQFLCCYHLGDSRGKHNALYNLELTIRKRYFIIPNKIIFKTVYKSLDIVKAINK
ncbi:Hypothetical predicted protein [Mytilus galloprovincialis]|uniref:Mab-21-like HhH/H2TH-like domain-containing protein n=1 Tax=Mytilus galloprovincialis TaxID=29158 RepID=A0A8B6CRM6_MYTGA|nr:Hypothetical predicted protein [Mytilus galloprovincialis]